MKPHHLIWTLFIAFSVCLGQVTENPGNRKAPSFSLESIDGTVESLSTYTAKGPVLLSFWATWCKPCMEELPQLQKLQDEFIDKGFTLLAISTDNEKSISRVKPLVKSKKFTFTVLLDPNSDAAKKYYAAAMPYTVLIDKSGKIVYTHLGYTKGDEESLRTKILELVK